MTGTSPIRIGVLAIQGGYDAHARMLSLLGAEPVLIRKPAELAEVEALILPGGESTTILKFLERDSFLEVLRDFTQSHATFGTCAGCILLAQQVLHPAQTSLGVLDVTVERNAYGRQSESMIQKTTSVLPGGPLEMVYIRAPRIVRMGARVQVLAERDGAPVLVREGHVLAATFHPELSDDVRVHEYFLAMVRGASARP